MTSIMTEVDNVLKNPPSNIAVGISTAVAAIMNPTWYVAYIYKPSEADQDFNSVCYGYAFRNRWIWTNNLTPGVTVILWKDYNCATPTSKTINDFYSDAILQLLGQYSKFTEFANLLPFLTGTGAHQWQSGINPLYVNNPW